MKRKERREAEARERWLKVNVVGHDPSCECVKCWATIFILSNAPSRG